VQNYSQEIKSIDSAHVSLDRQALKLVLTGLIERDSYYEQLQATQSEINIVNQESDLKSEQITVLNNEINDYKLQIINYKQPWYDKFWIGAITATVLAATFIIISP
jgi:hypothetical protein